MHNQNPRDAWHEPYWIESPISGQMIRNPRCAITFEQYLQYYVSKDTNGQS